MLHIPSSISIKHALRLTKKKEKEEKHFKRAQDCSYQGKALSVPIAF